ncbi:hypothetical protein D3C85_772110 [compost metagenome]
MGRPVGTLLFVSSLQAPFPNGYSGITGIFEYSGHGVVVFEGLIKLIIPDVGIALVYSCKQ